MSGLDRDFSIKSVHPVIPIPPEQIPDNSIEGKKLAINVTDYFYYDEMLYPLISTIPYDNEGTISNTARGMGTINALTSSVLGARGRFNTDTTDVDFTPALGHRMRARIKLNSTASINFFLGFFDALPTAAAPSVEPSDGIYFRAIGGNWFAISRNASSETAVDTGVSITTGSRVFEIVLTSTSIEFLIDTVSVATIITNIPIVALFWGVVIVTQITAIKSFDIDFLFLTGARD